MSIFYYKNMSLPAWHHSPSHLLSERGMFMVTAGTAQKTHFFAGNVRLRYLQTRLLECAEDFGWRLQAWCVFPNHYHFLALSPEDPRTLSKLIRQLHGSTSLTLNRLDGTLGRKVWFQYWDSKITYERSYLARLNYIHQNAVRHGIVRCATDYQWSSARNFFATASAGLQRTVLQFTQEPRVADDF